MRASFTKSINALVIVGMACATLGNPALANSTITYVCTPGGGAADATAVYENIDGNLAIALRTVENGKSDAGINLADIPYPAKEFAYIHFNMSGFPNAQHGPYLIMDGFLKGNTPATVIVEIGNVKSTNNGNGSWHYLVVEKDLKLAGKKFYPLHIYIQDYAGADDGSAYIFENITFNGSTFTPQFGLANDCYAGTTHP